MPLSFHLAQVVVIGILELVLDDHLASGAGFLRIDVDVERAHRRLGLYKLKLNTDCRAQYGKVGLLGEPLGEVKRLLRPYIAQIDFLQLVEAVLHRIPIKSLARRALRPHQSKAELNAIVEPALSPILHPRALL